MEQDRVQDVSYAELKQTLFISSPIKELFLYYIF